MTSTKPEQSDNEWEILTYPDPRLRKRSEPIVEITDDIRKKGLALMDLMHEAKGIGLAAPQVDWHVQMLAINPMNLDGEFNQFELDGLLARCFLHEYDHLDGILFIDRVSPARKLSLKKKLKALRDSK